jgi:translocation and assembly module TamB
MNSLLKKLLIAFAALILLVVVLSVAASVYLNSAAFRRLLIDEIDAAIAGRVLFSDHHVAPLSGRVTLTDVELIEPDGETVASIEQLDLRIYLPALAWRTVHIPRLTIDTLFLSLKFDNDDQLNLSRALAGVDDPPPEAPAEADTRGFQVKLDDFKLKDGNIVFERPAMELSGIAEGIDVSGLGDLEQQTGRLVITLASVSMHTPDGGHTLRDLTVAAEYNAHSPEPLAVAIETPQSSVMVQGRIDPQDPGLRMALTGDLDIELAEARAWLPESLNLSGRAKGRISVAGAPADPSVAFSMEWTEGTVWELDAQRVVLDVRLEQRQVSIAGAIVRSRWGDLDLSGAMDLRPLFPASFEQQVAGLEKLIYHLDIDARDLAPGELPSLDFPWGGVWGTRVRLEGTGLPDAAMMGGVGKARVHLQGDGVQVAQDTPPVRAEASVDVGWAPGRLEISQGSVHLGAHRIAAAGSIDLQREQLQLSGQAHSPHIDALGHLLGVALPSGAATLEFSSQGPWLLPMTQAGLRATDLIWEDWTIGQLTVEADLDDSGTVNVSRLALENRESRLSGAGRLELLAADGGMRPDPPLTFTLDMDSLDLAHFNSELQDIAARLKGALRLGGTIGQPTADLTISPSPVRWGELAAMLQGAFLFNGSRLTVSDLTLEKDRSILTLQGVAQLLDTQTGEWTADPWIEADVTRGTVYLESFLPEYSGALDLAANVKGRASALEGTFRLDGTTLDFAVQQLASLRIEGRLLADSVEVDQLLVVPVPGQQVRGSGRYGFDESFEAHLRTQGLELQHIDVLADGPAISGRIDMDINAQGTLAHPEATMRMRIREPGLEQQQWDDFTVNVDLKGRQLEVDADLNFKLEGNALLDNGDFELKVDFEQTDLAPYLALLMDADWSGRLSGRVQASGNWQDLPKVRGDVVLSDARLNYQQIQLLTMDRLEAHLIDGILDLPSTRLEWMQKGYLDVAAAGDLQKGLTLQADGRLPLAALAPFTDAIDEPAGDLRIEARGSGPLSQIAWNADLVLEHIAFYLPDMDQAVSRVNGRVQVTPEQITLHALNGMLDTGRFAFDGRVALDDMRPSGGKLTIALTGMPVQVPGTMDARINADMVLTGDGRRGRLEGNVILLEGAYYEDLRLNLLSVITQTAQRVERAEPVREVQPPPQWLDAIDLDVTLTHRYPFLVDNNVALLEIVPDLRISGTAARPVLDGRAAIPEGEVYFRRHTFNVKRGVVDFIHPYRIEPTLDIVAETTIQKWLITLTIKGTPDDLSITLHSNPPETDSNILSLILLGRTADDVGRAGSATTSQMLASLVESAWGEDIRKGIGLDILEVETGASPNDENQERIQVTVGKRLSPRLTVKYSVETGSGETVQRATSEYRLLENILASGFQDTLGVYGGELLFRIEFR